MSLDPLRCEDVLGPTPAVLRALVALVGDAVGLFPARAPTPAPAPPTGLGDIFVGAFLRALSAFLGLLEPASLVIAVAAVAVGTIGTPSAISPKVTLLRRTVSSAPPFPASRLATLVDVFVAVKAVGLANAPIGVDAAPALAESAMSPSALLLLVRLLGLFRLVPEPLLAPEDLGLACTLVLLRRECFADTAVTRLCKEAVQRTFAESVRPPLEGLEEVVIQGLSPAKSDDSKDVAATVVLIPPAKDPCAASRSRSWWWLSSSRLCPGVLRLV
mmetsp:Transcript_18634/g.32293  ORF Transcript_18634/g.32293 Transcript_18634/m.32293 type:complete len:273 (-) Transcript_18634:434-1252(-)